ncbi:MAG: VanZ family protein [Acidimicrobiia bacterium]|nr:VanZ family protein [Acidimicrobiia bacterium]
MRGVFDNFGLAIWLSAGVFAVTVLLAASTPSNPSGSGHPRRVRVARIFTLGFALIATLATSLRGRRLVFESGGDLVLVPGGGGLGDLEQIAASPTSLAAVLLAGNVLLYIPIGFAGTIGWYDRRRLVLAGCLLLSVAVETVQLLALGRVAATDDVILNMVGASIGYVLAILIVRREVDEAESDHLRGRGGT